MNQFVRAEREIKTLEEYFVEWKRNENILIPNKNVIHNLIEVNKYFEDSRLEFVSLAMRCDAT